MPQFLIQAAGKPSHTALAHLSELPLYILLAWVGIELGGVVGAAIAWAIRGIIDLIIMMILARRQMPGMAGRTAKLFMAFAVAIGGLAGMVFLPDSLAGMMGGSALIVAVLPVAWWLLLGASEKELIMGIIGRVLKRT